MTRMEAMSQGSAAIAALKDVLRSAGSGELTPSDHTP
jgi:hypothetical protein